MKKTLLTALITLTLVCLFAFGASAYQNDYFSIDIPSDYVISDEGTMFTAQKSGAVITITCGDAMGDTFANLTAAQKSGYDDIIKNTYKEYGTISNYTSEFGGEKDLSVMAFSFTITGGTLDGIVEGVMYIIDDFLYHAVYIVSDEALYDEVVAISDTFKPNSVAADTAKPDANTSDSAITTGADDGYSTKYYTMGTPEGFTLRDDSTEERTMWITTNGSALSIVVTDNTIGADYGALNASELETLKSTIRTTYENLGVTSFESLECESTVFNGISCANYKVECALSGGDISVNGYILSTEDNIITIEAACRNTEDAAAVSAALRLFKIAGLETPPADTVVDAEEPEDNTADAELETEEAGSIKFKSKGNLVSFTLDESFVEIVPGDQIESQWTRNDGKVSVAYATFENEDFGYLMDLTDEELKMVSKSFTEGIGLDDIDDFRASNVNINGYKGVKLTGEFEVTGIDTEAEVYMFASKEKAMAIYFFFYNDDIDSDVIDEILDTLRIDAELYERPDDMTFVIIGAGAVLLLIIIITVISKSKKNKRKAAYAQQYQPPFNGYPNNYPNNNYPNNNYPNNNYPNNNYPNNNFPQNQGMNGNYNQNNNF